MKRPIVLFILLCFIFTGVTGPCPIYAQDFVLPAPGQMVALSPSFSPAVLKGIQLDAKNPFRFHFFVDRGDSSLSQEELKSESAKLIKYFLASLTIPEKDLWVNLSPYEKDRIVPQEFGQTEMGRDLLAEDYMLKQITASLIYPESRLGKEFWAKVYAKAQAKYGTTNIPINTFNKVWIVPEKAVVYENGGVAFVLENHLKVMLDQDYLSLQKNTGIESVLVQAKDTNQLGSQIVREIVIPALTKEVNEGKNFAQLRQVFYSLILATWYKKKIKDSILNKVYSNRNMIGGVNVSVRDKDRIYQEYLRAFKKGVYNYIKEEADPVTNEVIPRKYFSGGFTALTISDIETTVGRRNVSPAKLDALIQRRMDLNDVFGDCAMINKNSVLSAEGGKDGAMLVHNAKFVGSLEQTIEDIKGYFLGLNAEKLEIGADTHFVKTYAVLKEKVVPLALKTAEDIKAKVTPLDESPIDPVIIEQFKIIYAMALENAIDAFWQKRDMVEAKQEAFEDTLKISVYFKVNTSSQGEKLELIVVNNGVPLKIAEDTKTKQRRREEKGLGKWDRSGGRGAGLETNIAAAARTLAGEDVKPNIVVYDRQEKINDGQEGAVLDVQIPFRHMLEWLGQGPVAIPLEEAIYIPAADVRDKKVIFKGEEFSWFEEGAHGSAFSNHERTKVIKVFDRIAVKEEHVKRLFELNHMLARNLGNEVIRYDQILHLTNSQEGHEYWGLLMPMEKGEHIDPQRLHEFRPQAGEILHKIDFLTWFLADRHTSFHYSDDLRNFLKSGDGRLIDVDMIDISKLIEAMEDEKLSLNQVAWRYIEFYRIFDRRDAKQAGLLANYRERLLQRIAFELKYRIIQRSQEEIKEQLMATLKDLVTPHVNLNGEESNSVDGYLNLLSLYIVEYQNKAMTTMTLTPSSDEAMNGISERTLIGTVEYTQEEINGYLQRFNQEKIRIGENTPFVEGANELKAMVLPLVLKTVEGIKSRLDIIENHAYSNEFLIERFKTIYSSYLENAIDSFLQKKSMVESDGKAFLDKLELSAYFYPPGLNSQNPEIGLLITNNGVPLAIAEKTEDKKKRRAEKGVGRWDRSGGLGLGMGRIKGAVRELDKDAKEVHLYDRQGLLNDGKEGAVLDIRFSLLAHGVMKEAQQSTAIEVSKKKRLKVESFEVNEEHDQAYHQISNAITTEKIPPELPIILFDQHSDNEEFNKDNPIGIGNWLTALVQEKKVGDAFWIYPEGREVAANRPVADFFRDTGKDLEKILVNHQGRFRNGVILSFDMDYFASTSRNRPAFLPLQGEIRSRLVEIFALFKKYNIPIYLVNGAYSAPIFAPDYYKPEFGDALGTAAQDYVVEADGAMNVEKAQRLIASLNQRTDELLKIIATSKIRKMFLDKGFDFENTFYDRYVNLGHALSSRIGALSRTIDAGECEGIKHYLNVIRTISNRLLNPKNLADLRSWSERYKDSNQTDYPKGFLAIELNDELFLPFEMKIKELNSVIDQLQDTLDQIPKTDNPQLKKIETLINNVLPAPVHLSLRNMDLKMWNKSILHNTNASWGSVYADNPSAREWNTIFYSVDLSQPIVWKHLMEDIEKWVGIDWSKEQAWQKLKGEIDSAMAGEIGGSLVNEAMTTKDIDWGTSYANRPRLLDEDKLELKQQSLIKLLIEKRLQPDEIVLFKKIEAKQSLSNIEQEEVDNLIKKGMVYRLRSGNLIPVYWIESADEIPLERRGKILEALINGGLLINYTRKELDENSTLMIEYFDDRGDNRRVLLVSQDGENPFVVKYVHKHIRAAGEQQLIMGKVIDYEQSFSIERSLYDKFSDTFGPDLVPVPKPGQFVKIDDTEIFTEEFIDGPTREDLTDYLTKAKGYPVPGLEKLLARIEGRSLARIWQGTKEINRGQVLHDFHENNVKFVRVHGGYLAKYFDFETSEELEQVGALQAYMHNREIPRLNEDEFILGWAEGLGYQRAYDFFRMINFRDDKLGIIVRLINAVYEMSSNGEKTKFYDLDNQTAGNTIDDIKNPVLFIYQIFTNQKIDQLPVSREKMLQDLKKALRDEFRFKNANDIIEQLSNVFYNASFGHYQSFDGLIKDLRDIRTKAINQGLSLNLFQSGVSPALSKARMDPKRRKADLEKIKDHLGIQGDVVWGKTVTEATLHTLVDEEWLRYSSMGQQEEKNWQAYLLLSESFKGWLLEATGHSFTPAQEKIASFICSLILRRYFLISDSDRLMRNFDLKENEIKVAVNDDSFRTALENLSALIVEQREEGGFLHRIMHEQYSTQDDGASVETMGNDVFVAVQYALKYVHIHDDAMSAANKQPEDQTIKAPESITYDGKIYKIKDDTGTQGVIYYRQEDGTAIKVFNKIKRVRREHLNRLLDLVQELRLEKPDSIVPMHAVVDISSDMEGFPKEGILMDWIEGTNLERSIEEAGYIPQKHESLVAEAIRIIDWIYSKTDGLADQQFKETIVETEPAYGNFIISSNGTVINVDPIDMKLLMKKMSQVELRKLNYEVLSAFLDNVGQKVLVSWERKDYDDESVLQLTGCMTLIRDRFGARAPSYTKDSINQAKAGLEWLGRFLNEFIDGDLERALEMAQSHQGGEYVKHTRPLYVEAREELKIAFGQLRGVLNKNYPRMIELLNDLEPFAKDAAMTGQERTADGAMNVILGKFGFSDQSGELKWDSSKNTQGEEWMMKSIRDIEKRPIIMDKKHIPIIRIDQKSRILYRTSTHPVYIAIATIDGKKQPVVIKAMTPWGFINAQIVDRLGIGPKFYGIVKYIEANTGRKTTGYVMQFVPGSSVLYNEIENEPDFRIISDRLFEVGLTPPTEVIRTPWNRLIAIDTDEIGAYPGAEADRMYQSFLDECNHSDNAMVNQNIANKGGIDLNPAQMTMQVKKDGQDFKFDFNGKEIDAAQVTGATFTIRTMTPVTDLPLILGLKKEGPEMLLKQMN